MIRKENMLSCSDYQIKAPAAGTKTRLDPALSSRALRISAKRVALAVAAFEEHYYDYTPECATDMAMRFALAAAERG